MGSLILYPCREKDSLLKAALGAGAGGSNSVSGSCDDIVGLCLVGLNKGTLKHAYFNAG